MKIEMINEHQIRCTLTREDLESRQINLSELTYGSEKAKSLFRDMMKQAADDFGFDAEDIPLMIEAIPLSNEAIMLIISGPACFIAWRKLRRRNLGPVLNANGWAVNSKILINILFGKTLTSVAKYPVVKGNDPYVKKIPVWRKILRWLIALLIVAFGCLYFTDNLGCIGLPRHKAQAEEVVEAPETVVEEAAQPAPEAAPAETPAE